MRVGALLHGPHAGYRRRHVIPRSPGHDATASARRTRVARDGGVDSRCRWRWRSLPRIP